MLLYDLDDLDLITVMVHCEGRGLEAIVGHKSHILLNEQGGIAQVCLTVIAMWPLVFHRNCFTTAFSIIIGCKFLSLI